MMFHRLWQRYLFKHLCKCFFLFLCSFFFLYSLIDFSTHAQDFFVDGTLSLSKLALYYSNQLIKRLQLLLPLALLISAIKTLTSFNRHRELVALLSAGIPLKKLLQPFFVLAFLCMATGYLNEEVLMPRSTAFLEEIKQTQVSLKKNKKKPFHVLYLQDSSRLIYQTFDEEHQSFFDVYWIRSFSDFWRIKTLHADPKNPIACYVDHIVRNEEGFLEKKESYEQCMLPSLKWKSSQLIYKKQSSIKHQKLSKLCSLFFHKQSDSFHAQGEIATQFFHKLLMPLLPLLALIGVVPFCVQYSRNPPLCMIYGLSIFCFVGFFTLVNAMVILGENQTLSPWIAMGLPFLLGLSLCLPRFYTLK